MPDQQLPIFAGDLRSAVTYPDLTEAEMRQYYEQHGLDWGWPDAPQTVIITKETHGNSAKNRQ